MYVAKGHGAHHRGRAPVAWLLLVMLGTGLVLGACSGPAGVKATNAAAAMPQVPLQRALDAMLRPSSARSASVFLASLPRPLGIDEHHVFNPHQARVVDTIRTLRFAGLAVSVYRATSTGDRFPVAVTVTSPAYLASNGLHVGMRRDRVRALLGPPDAAVADRWIYQIDPPLSAPYELTLRFRGNHVSELRWAAYLD